MLSHKPEFYFALWQAAVIHQCAERAAAAREVAVNAEIARLTDEQGGARLGPVTPIGQLYPFAVETGGHGRHIPSGVEIQSWPADRLDAKTRTLLLASGEAIDV